MTLANASLRARGNQDLRNARVQNIQPQAGLVPLVPPVSGIGGRLRWPYPAVGEAARRDPHIPDPVPNPPHANSSQANADPPTRHTNGFGTGDGLIFTGFPPTLAYIKRLGRTMTRSLARNHLAGLVDARWRLGGVSLPFDQWGMGYGIGYQGDAQSVWFDNPQVYLRNPGIKPLTSVPATYRYVTLVGNAPVGPSIGDFGTMPVPGTP